MVVEKVVEVVDISTSYSLEIALNLLGIFGFYERRLVLIFREL